MNTCKQIQVIETTFNRDRKEPASVTTQYWTLEGILIAEVDPCKPKGLSSYSTKALTEELIKRAGVHQFIIGADEKIYGQYFDSDGNASSNNKKVQMNGPSKVLIFEE